MEITIKSDGGIKQDASVSLKCHDANGQPYFIPMKEITEDTWMADLPELTVVDAVVLVTCTSTENTLMIS